MSKSKLFYVYLTYFVSMALFCTLSIAASFGFLSSLTGVMFDIVYTLLIQIGIMIILPCVLYTLLVGRNRGIKYVFHNTRIAKVNYKIILLSIAIGILVFLLNIIISSFFNGFIGFFGYSAFRVNTLSVNSVTALFFIEVLTVAVLPSIGEEVLHRGLLLSGINHIGYKKAILISSILFGLIHFNIQQVFYAFVIGLILALITVVTKSIFPAMIIHFLNNFIGLYLEYASKNNWFGSGFYDGFNSILQNNFIITFVTIFAILLVVAALILWLIYIMFKVCTLNKVKKAISSIYQGGGLKGNRPIEVQKNQIVQEMLENRTTLNLEYEEMENPIDYVLPKQDRVFKSGLEDNIFLISSGVLGVLVTLFTFIWGL